MVSSITVTCDVLSLSACDVDGTGPDGTSVALALSTVYGGLTA